jgi:hypothetical protein
MNSIMWSSGKTGHALGSAPATSADASDPPGGASPHMSHTTAFPERLCLIFSVGGRWINESRLISLCAAASGRLLPPESNSGHKRHASRRNRCRLRPHSRDSPTLNPGEQWRSAQAGRRRMISLTGRRGVAGSGPGCGKPSRSTSCGDSVPPRTSSRSTRRVDPTSSG